MEALAGMQSFLRGRPSTFKSLEHAIEYWSEIFPVNLDSAYIYKKIDNNMLCNVLK